MRSSNGTLWTAGAMLAMLLFAGCSNGGGGSIIGPQDLRNYGPPYFQVGFTEEGGYVGTVSPEGGSEPLYIRNLGGLSSARASFGFHFQPGSTISELHVLAQDTADNTLYLIDENGVVPDSFANVEPHLFAFSPGGQSLAYFQQISPDSLVLISHGVYPSQQLDEGARVGAPLRVTAAPSYSLGADRLVFAAEDPADPDNAHIALHGVTGELISLLPVRALAPTFSNDGSTIAYIDIPDGRESASELVLLSGNSLTNELARINFGSIATGAAAFSWSPDDSQIALFAGIGSGTPVPVLVDVQQQTATEIPLSLVPAIGSGEQRIWAAPAWEPSGNHLALMVESDSSPGSWELITTTLDASDLLTLQVGLESPGAVRWMQPAR